VSRRLGYTVSSWANFGVAVAGVGGALVGWAVLSLVLMYVLDRRAGHGSMYHAARHVERFSPNAVTSILLGIGGATFFAKHGGGLYWLLPTVAVSLLGGVLNAWVFLVSDD
jgi:hypothetical protein